MAETEKIREELERLIPGESWPRAYPAGQVPEGYFDKLPGRVLEAVAPGSEEEAGLSWGKTNPYAVPAGYFDQLPGIVARKLTPAPAPMVSLPRQRPLSRWSSWAAAAVITGMIALSGLLWFTNPPSAPASGSVEQQIAGLSSDAIEQYLSNATNTLNSDEILNTLNDDNIQDASSGRSSRQVLEEYLNDEIPDSLY